MGCRTGDYNRSTGKYSPGPGGPPDTLETCLKARSESAGRLKAAAPHKMVRGPPPHYSLMDHRLRSRIAWGISPVPHPDQTRQVLDYRGIVIAWWNYQTPEHAAWWIKGDSPPWRWRHWRAALYASFVIPR